MRDRPRPGSPPLPDAAARAVVREDLDRSLLLEAGAGSGKTQCLADRMAAGILAGRYEVEGMAAVTFTRKAAAELRGRFQVVLEARLLEERAAGKRDRAERAERALQRLERLFAGTIHAFCAHLLRERPVEAGVAPGFEELDEDADYLHRRRAWREHLDRARAAGSPALAALLDAGVTPGDLDGAFDLVCAYPEVDFPAPAVPPPATEQAAAALDAFHRTLLGHLPGPIAADTTCKVQERLRALTRALRVADLSRGAALAELLTPWRATLAIVQSRWADTPTGKRRAKDTVDPLVADFRERVVEPFLAAWYPHVYGLAVPLLVAARAHAEADRRRALTLNYGDLLLRAAALLRDEPAVRAALQDRYRWLFVDEFQDTDPIQAEVLLLLAAAPSAERDWARVPLRPGALFIVGDPKQSIYRFRRADIDTYLRVRARLVETGGRVEALTASFRAVPAVCDWANRVFRALLPAAATSHQPAFHGLVPVKEPGRRPEGVRTLTVPDGAKDVEDHAAEVVARFIRAQLDAGRPAGDFLVLTRVRRHLGVYARALEARRVPIEVSGGGAFVESASVKALADLLRALADPDDALGVVGVLRGPLFGVSDPALYAHRAAGRGFLMTAPEVDAWEGPVGEALAALRQMHRWTRSLPVPAAVERMLEATGLLARAAATTPGGAEAGDLLHAVDRVRRVWETGGTLTDAADALEADLRSTEVESVPLEPGRRDVVRVMNLHKAKGLEARVVVLAEPSGTAVRSADVRIVREGPRAVGHFPIRRRLKRRGTILLAQPADWPRLEAEELAYLDAELLRLLYVATTRAAELLVVTRHRNRGPWRALAPHLAGVPELDVPGLEAPPPAPLPDLGEAARARAEAERAARRQATGRPSWRVESVTATAHLAAPPGRPLPAGRTREPDTGMAWGRLVHALLEHAMRGPRRDRAHLARLAAWLTVDRPELRRVLPEALDTVEEVMAGELWRRALAAPERHVEAPFAVRATDGAEGAGPLILHGVVDLAFREGDAGAGRWTVVDYKTDQAPLDALVVQYGEQVRTYARRWAQLAGGTVERAALYAIRHRALSDDLAGGAGAPPASR